MEKVLFVLGPFWFLFSLAGYWLMKNTKDFQDAGVGVLAIAGLFGIDSYVSNQIQTWNWWEQALVIISVLACYLSGMVGCLLIETKTSGKS